MFEFIESPVFERLIYEYLDDESYVKSRDGRIWLITIYSKGATGNIPAHLLKAWKQEFVHGEDD